MKNNVLTYLPTTIQLTDTPAQQLSIAEVAEMQNGVPLRVTLNHQDFSVMGYLSQLPGIVPSINLGDKVLISSVEQGVLIHGVVMPLDAPARASFGFVGDKLVIEAQGAVVLKSGTSTVELTEAGAIRIDGRDVRTVAKKTLTLLGGRVNLN